MTTLFPDVVVRDDLDFNRTPAWCVELLVPHLGQPQTILDAGCGDGAIGRVLRRAFPDPPIYGIELDSARCSNASHAPEFIGGWAYGRVFCTDWTRDELAIPRAPIVADLIISNPPFGLAALDFLRCALARVRPGGTVAFLLPTHWDHDPDVRTGFARQRFLDAIRLPDGREGYAKLAIVGGGPNPARPSFRGGSDSASDRYAWFMFGEKWAGQPSRRLHAIPPKESSGQTSFLGVT